MLQIKHMRSNLQVVHRKFAYDYWDFVVSYSLFVPFIDDPPTPKKSTLRGHHDGKATFSFLTSLFCGELANQDVEKKKGVEKRRQIYQVRALDTIDSIWYATAECNNSLG